MESGRVNSVHQCRVNENTQQRSKIVSFVVVGILLVSVLIYSSLSGSIQVSFRELLIGLTQGKKKSQ